MENTTTEEGISLGELFRLIGKRIWYILGISVLVALLAGLIFAFGLNPKSKTYSLDFTISYPSGDTMKYPDGSPFYYRAIVSSAMLEEAKASDERFASIDVAGMLKSDDIDITAQSQEIVSESWFTGSYTLTVKSSYFSNQTIATDYLRAVANVPVNRIVSLANEIDYMLDYNIFEAASFNDRLELLAELKEGLLAQYDEWISLYRDNYLIAGKTLKNHKADVTVVYSDSTQEMFLKELTDYGYVQKEYIEQQIAILEEERSLNKRMIAALQEAINGSVSSDTATVALVTAETTPDNGTDDDTTNESSQTVVSVNSYLEISAQIANLTIRNEQIAYQISKLTEENITEFEGRIKAEYDKLAAAAETMNAVAGAIYAQQSAVMFSTSKATEDGGTSVILAAVAGFIVAFIIAAIVFCIMELSAQKQRKPEELAADASCGDEPTDGNVHEDNAETDGTEPDKQ